MPQPLLRGQRYEFEPRSLEKRPALAAHIGSIAASWTYVEQLSGFLLANLIGGNASAAIEMYLALTSTVAQREALKAAAKARLSAALYEEFLICMNNTRRFASDRHTIVHGWWGICLDNEHVLVLRDPRLAIRFIAQYPFNSELTEPEAEALWSRRPPLLGYSAKDFIFILTRIINLESETRLIYDKISSYLREVQR